MGFNIVSGNISGCAESGGADTRGVVTYNMMHEQNLWDGELRFTWGRRKELMSADTLMMSGLPLTQIGLLQGREDYLAEATYQVCPSTLTGRVYLS
jgi:rhamnogalacturonyl hydrolase YesR